MGPWVTVASHQQQDSTVISQTAIDLKRAYQCNAEARDQKNKTFLRGKERKFSNLYNVPFRVFVLWTFSQQPVWKSFD